MSQMGTYGWMYDIAEKLQPHLVGVSLYDNVFKRNPATREVRVTYIVPHFPNGVPPEIVVCGTIEGFNGFHHGNVLNTIVRCMTLEYKLLEPPYPLVNEFYQLARAFGLNLWADHLDDTGGIFFGSQRLLESHE